MTDRLTSLERSVLQLLGTGFDVPEIARQLGVHESTALWCVGHLVATYGPQRVEALAASLSRAGSAEALVAAPSWAPRRSIVGASVLYALSIGLLVTSIAVAAAWVVDGVHNGAAATAGPASPAPSGSALPSVPAATLDPLATVTYTPQSGQQQYAPGAAATVPPLAPLLTAVPSALPLPSVPGLPVPTAAPTSALPLPPLPTIPPLPTPHLP
jgi:hypothetical protein